jgi:hypothetical protein
MNGCAAFKLHNHVPLGGWSGCSDNKQSCIHVLFQVIGNIPSFIRNSSDTYLIHAREVLLNFQIEMYHFYHPVKHFSAEVFFSCHMLPTCGT